jgi:hypothetical protein
VEQLIPGRFYIDEDPQQDLAHWLSDVGHEAVSTTQLGHKGKAIPGNWHSPRESNARW